MYSSISEGTLIATVGPGHADELLSALEVEGIPAADVGEVLPRGEGRTISVGGEHRPLEHPGQDPFWEAFGRWSEEAAGS